MPYTLLEAVGVTMALVADLSASEKPATAKSDEEPHDHEMVTGVPAFAVRGQLIPRGLGVLKEEFPCAEASDGNCV